ncbi:hydrogenase subunit MbhD domain-containing protein [Thioalkalicoccus limnaeus]|uniref:Hydrogenase subunit MbhD domain-containing protein n=1 Tax=Thioalkalicoccus limnaeus TaxID=120681 RepID=A0ABV4BJU5_9GAMM
MTMDLTLFDLLLVVSLIAMAVFCLFSADIQRAVILFIVFGLLMALAWARLRAPDVALAEAAIGAGLSGAMLLAAARRSMEGQRRRTDLRVDREEGPR